MGAVETVKYEMVNLACCLYELSGLTLWLKMEEAVFMASLLKSLMSDNKKGNNENSCYNINQYMTSKNTCL